MHKPTRIINSSSLPNLTVTDRTLPHLLLLPRNRAKMPIITKPLPLTHPTPLSLIRPLHSHSETVPSPTPLKIHFHVTLNTLTIPTPKPTIKTDLPRLQVDACKTILQGSSNEKYEDTTDSYIVFAISN